ncbi:proteasome subunit beta [Haloarchaeobius sp. HRN-SO-5]|uniref:proteasome subunit beta n=1 Tax=Haloarchaeobius sp. HRN-SO-5 TaxID=3446118 RepID=UPI003EBEEB1D
MPDSRCRSRTGREPGGRETGTGPATEFDVATVDTDAPVLETGTTIVAVATDDAVVVGADQRASLGGRFVANKDVDKLERVHPTGVVALSGSVGGLQSFADTLRAEANLYDARRGDPMSITALASVAGSLVRGLPAQVLLAGVDAAGTSARRTQSDEVDGDGAAVYELDGGGGVVATDYAAGGSGMQVAYGVLEGRAETVDSVDAARDLVADAVSAASERDTASGNGITVATVTADGVDVGSFDDAGEVA